MDLNIFLRCSASDVELLQRYRRDRRELLSFLLSSDVLKRVVMPPGAVSIEDLGLDEISVDYILDCARKGRLSTLVVTRERVRFALEVVCLERTYPQPELSTSDQGVSSVSAYPS